MPVLLKPKIIPKWAGYDVRETQSYAENVVGRSFVVRYDDVANGDVADEGVVNDGHVKTVDRGDDCDCATNANDAVVNAQ